MNVASLELCKELYHLSGWKDTDNFYQYQGYEDGSSGYYLINVILEAPLHANAYPAYDLGYVLRRLPQNSWVGYVDTSGKRGYALAKTYAWNEKGTDIDKIAECTAHTPEDAACKLAIELRRMLLIKWEDELKLAQAQQAMQATGIPNAIVGSPALPGQQFPKPGMPGQPPAPQGGKA